MYDFINADLAIYAGCQIVFSLRDGSSNAFLLEVSETKRLSSGKRLTSYKTTELDKKNREEGDLQLQIDKLF